MSDVEAERDWMREPPTTYEELVYARENVIYAPVFEQCLNEDRWTIDKWTCPRCGASQIAPFNGHPYDLRNDAFNHMRRHEWEDEQRVRYAAVLEHYNSQPNYKAWIDPDGRMRVAHTRPASPRTPGRFARWLKRRSKP